MGKRIHKNDEMKRRFIQVDKILLENPKYQKMSEGSILAYSILRDRLDLSKENEDIYTDEEGYLYLIYTDEELGEILHRTRQTASNRKKELEKFGLIEMMRMGNQQPNRIYICEPDYCSPEEYLSYKYRQKKKGERAKKEQERIENFKKKYMLIEVEDVVEEPETVGAVMMPKNLTSPMPKFLTSSCQKNVHHDVKNFGTNNTEYIQTENNDTEYKNLNPNPRETDIYEILWDIKIPQDLKNRVKVMIVNKQLFLSSEQILLIEDAYKYQIQKGFVIPNCDINSREALNDYEFSKTVIKMLGTVKDIKNIRGLIKEWVEIAYTYKRNQLDVSDYSTNESSSYKRKVPFYNWLES